MSFCPPRSARLIRHKNQLIYKLTTVSFLAANGIAVFTVRSQLLNATDENLPLICAIGTKRDFLHLHFFQSPNFTRCLIMHDVISSLTAPPWFVADVTASSQSLTRWRQWLNGQRLFTIHLCYLIVCLLQWINWILHMSQQEYLNMVFALKRIRHLSYFTKCFEQKPSTFEISTLWW